MGTYAVNLTLVGCIISFASVNLGGLNFKPPRLTEAKLIMHIMHIMHIMLIMLQTLKV